MWLQEWGKAIELLDNTGEAFVSVLRETLPFFVLFLFFIGKIVNYQHNVLIRRGYETRAPSQKRALLYITIQRVGRQAKGPYHELYTAINILYYI